MVTNDMLFSETAELLMQGGFVCQQAFPEAHSLLSGEGGRTTMELFLRKIGRSLRLTGDGSTFYAAYASTESQSRKNALRQQFTSIINELEPLCRWLALLMSATQRDASLKAGDVVRMGELLTAIESTAALSAELDRMTRVGIFKTTRDSISDRLAAVLSVLEREGYLITSNKGRTWIATGKWSYLDDVLEFIHTHENIQVSDDAGVSDPRQGALL